MKGFRFGRIQSQMPKVNTERINPRLRTPNNLSALPNAHSSNHILGVDRISGIENFRTPDIINSAQESLGNAAFLTARAEQINESLINGRPISEVTQRSSFEKFEYKVAEISERLFEGSGKLISDLTTFISWNKNGFNEGYVSDTRILFGLAGLAVITGIGIAALSAGAPILGAIGTIASLAGSSITLGTGAIIGGGFATLLGIQAGRNSRSSAAAWNRYGKHLAPIGMLTMYLGLAAVAPLASPFLLGNILGSLGLKAGTIAFGLSLMLPIIYSRYKYVSRKAKECIQANEGTIAPHNDKELRNKDINKSFFWHGQAVTFNSAYLAYRTISTSVYLFTVAGFSLTPIGMLAALGLSMGGFGLAYYGTKHLGKQKSPFTGILTGMGGGAAVPIGVGGVLSAMGGIEGIVTSAFDPVSFGVNLASGLAASAVLLADWHSGTHSLGLHKNAMRQQFPDVNVPRISEREKMDLAGMFGGASKLKAFMEKPFVTTNDIAFSALTSSFLDPYSHMDQLFLQCDANARQGRENMNQIQKSLGVRDRVQQRLNEVYELVRTRHQNQRDASLTPQRYSELIEALNEIAGFYRHNLPATLEEIVNIEQESDAKFNWGKIYDVSVKLFEMRAREFEEWANRLTQRVNSSNRLSAEEVEGIFQYLMDKFSLEVILLPRKDDLRYPDNVQKNENQMGTREIFGDTAIEILRFHQNSDQIYGGQPKRESIERIYSTHIRRKNSNWDHVSGEEYSWHSRADLINGTSDAEYVRNILRQHESHSRDIGFVINSRRNGDPIALEMKDNSILLVSEDFAGTMVLSNNQRIRIRRIFGDNEQVSIDRQGRPVNRYGEVIDNIRNNRDRFEALDEEGNIINIRVSTIAEHNATSPDQILLIARNNGNSIATGNARSLGVDSYYTGDLPNYATGLYSPRRLNVYSVDPAPYEINIDSEFNAVRTATEYIPILERDRQNKYLHTSYRFKEDLTLPFRNMPSKEHFSDFRIVWQAMQLKMTVGGQTVALPYLPEKNGMTANVKAPIENLSWGKFISRFGRLTTSFNLSFNNDKGCWELTATAPIERGEDDLGINNYIFTIPLHNATDRSVRPRSPRNIKELKALGDLRARRKDIEMFGTYNWRNITNIIGRSERQIDYNLLLAYFPNEEVSINGNILIATIEDTNRTGFQRRKIQIRVNENADLAGVQRISDISASDIEEITIIRHFDWSRKGQLENGEHVAGLDFLFNAGGNLVTREIPYMSRLFPENLDAIEELSLETFRENVGAKPFANYVFSFESRKEANEHSNGLPVFERTNEFGVTIYEIQRYELIDSIFKLGNIDPETAEISNATFNRRGDKITLSFTDWKALLLPFDKRLIDVGTEENPNVRVTRLVSKREAAGHFGSETIAWWRSGNEVGFVNSPDIKNHEAVIHVNAQTGEIIKKKKHGELLIQDEAFSQIEHEINWIDHINISENNETIRITFRNPYLDINHPEAFFEQEITLGRDSINQLRKSNSYYQSERLATGTMQERYAARQNDSSYEYHPELFQDEVYDKNGNKQLIPVLKITRTESSTSRRLRNALSSETVPENAEIYISKPNSGAELEILETNERIIVPVEEEIAQKHLFDPERNSRDAEDFAERVPRFEDGRHGLIIGPQLSLANRNWSGPTDTGHPYCAFDQSIFMSPRAHDGLWEGRPTSIVGPGGGIQPGKTMTGDKGARQTATVNNGTPVARPTRKAFSVSTRYFTPESDVPFFSLAPVPPTITEDYRESRGIYFGHGHSSIFHPKVVAIGGGVNFPKEVVTQRRRWPASVPIGQYWLSDRIAYEIKARFLRPFRSIPLIGSYFDLPYFQTADQMFEEINGIDWYYVGFAEYARNSAPLLYHLGLNPYVADPYIFPAFWLGQFGFGAAGYIRTMKKVGNTFMESMVIGAAANKALTDNYVEMNLPKKLLSKGATLTRLADEVLGQFGVTALAGQSKMPARYINRMSYMTLLSLTAAGLGAYKLNELVEFSLPVESPVLPNRMHLATKGFGIAMNTVWPAYTALLGWLAVRLCEKAAEENDAASQGMIEDYHLWRSRKIAGMLTRKNNRSEVGAARWLWDLTGNLVSLRDISIMVNLGIFDPPKTYEQKKRVIEGFSPEERARIFFALLNDGDAGRETLRRIIEDGEMNPYGIRQTINAGTRLIQGLEETRAALDPKQDKKELKATEESLKNAQEGMQRLRALFNTNNP